jgi:hypothetical protein
LYLLFVVTVFCVLSSPPTPPSPPPQSALSLPSFLVLFVFLHHRLPSSHHRHLPSSRGFSYTLATTSSSSFLVAHTHAHKSSLLSVSTTTTQFEYNDSHFSLPFGLFLPFIKNIFYSTFSFFSCWFEKPKERIS